MITAVVGSGGKTTRIHELAQMYREQGKRVFVTTSTHMFIEPDTLLTDDPEVILRRLEETGYVMAGLPDEPKICPLPEQVYARICAAADEVLVEADGSRHHPIKFPISKEPVIPENTDKILVVTGLHALGQPLREAAFRKEAVLACLGCGEDTLVTPEHMQKLLREGYLKPLRKRFPLAKIEIYAAGATSLYHRTVGKLLEQECDVRTFQRELTDLWTHDKNKCADSDSPHLTAESAFAVL